MTKFTPSKSIFYFLFLVFFSLNGCKNKENIQDAEAISNLQNDDPSADFDEAMLYEFNMIKNPTTGKIPVGSFEAEKEQASNIYRSQILSNRTTANSYSFQGPENLGGRTRSIVYDVRYNGTTNRTVFAAGVSGGIYKSNDDGASWTRKSPTSQHYSCTSIAQDTRAGFQDTWYYSTGESSGNSAGTTGAFYSGDGIYKSSDNGETWTRLANSNTTALETFSTAADFISKVIVDPTNGNVYAACLAAIRRSVDGGVTWASVLNGTLASTNQITDVVVTSAGILYASFAGTTNLVGFDGVWTSTSGDVSSWTRIAFGGTPVGWNNNGAYGRVVLGIAPSNENILYALYSTSASAACPGATAEADLFRYDRAITTWTDLSATLPDEPGCLSGNDPFAVQGGYDLVVAVKPDDPNTIFIGGTNIYRSTNTGATWTRIGGYVSASSYGLYANSHPDIHAITFEPGVPTSMFCGNDGGVQKTINNLAATVAWTQNNNGFRTYQYYYVDIDPRTGNNKVIGGAQDNGTTRNTGGTGNAFESVFSGDGVSVGLSNIISGSQFEYVGSQLGSISRRNSTSGPNFGTNIKPTGSGSGLFVTLFKLDPDNTENLYYANANSLYRTTSASTVTTTTWTNLTGIGTSVGAGLNITAITPTRGAYNPSRSSLFLGTSNGRVFRLDDPVNAAAAATPVNISGAFGAGNVSSIAVNPRNADTVLVTLSNYEITSVFWTGNATSATPTWTSVEGALTLPSYRSSAIAITQFGVEYYVGTSVGLYSSIGLPGTTNWVQEGAADIGNAVVSDLDLRTSDNNLLVGTHGYGMWKSSTLTVLPISLLSFSGSLQKDNITVQWATSSESNSKQFELEKSFDGVNFRTIATIAAAGNSSSIKNYSYQDKEVPAEKNYYRLKSVDIDGRSTRSNVILVKFEGATQGLVIMGNPFRESILIRFVKLPVGKIDIRLIDRAGRVVARQQATSPAQQLLFKTPANIAAGLYQLEVIIAGVKYSSTVLKQP